jgi:hypothetical protein
MEDPATWSEAEVIISKLLYDDAEQRALGSSDAYYAGLSLPRRIADALRGTGLLSRRHECCGTAEGTGHLGTCENSVMRGGKGLL